MPPDVYLTAFDYLNLCGCSQATETEKTYWSSRTLGQNRGQEENNIPLYLAYQMLQSFFDNFDEFEFNLVLYIWILFCLSCLPFV